MQLQALVCGALLQHIHGRLVDSRTLLTTMTSEGWTVHQFHACLLMRLMRSGHSTYGRALVSPPTHARALCSLPSGDVDAMGHCHLLSLSASSPAKTAPRSSCARPPVTVQSKSKTPRHPSTPDSEILVSAFPADPLEWSPSLFAHLRSAGLERTEAIVAYR